MSAFDRDVSDELTDLELKLLKAVDLEWESWANTEARGPMPRHLIDLMTKTHAALMQRVAKLGKDETIAWGPPEAALLRLEKIRQALLMKIEQRRRMTEVPH